MAVIGNEIFLQQSAIPGVWHTARSEPRQEKLRPCFFISCQAFSFSELSLCMWLSRA